VRLHPDTARRISASRKTRKPGKSPITAETMARVMALTCAVPPHQATYWTSRAMAKAIGVSVGSVQPTWRAHKLQRHRLALARPRFAAKLTDIVGLYLGPPAHFCQGWTSWLYVTGMPSLFQKNYGLDLKKSSFSI
jgi:hypothetical protein